uniref:Uncharacterized protein n=1 Tax=Rhizophora mucronata TaxID=61149 RepID=A0A2P2QYT1_RHIMU
MPHCKLRAIIWSSNTLKPNMLNKHLYQTIQI